MRNKLAEGKIQTWNICLMLRGMEGGVYLASKPAPLRRPVKE